MSHDEVIILAACFFVHAFMLVLLILYIHQRVGGGRLQGNIICKDGTAR